MQISQNLVFAEYDIFCLLIMAIITIKTVTLSRKLKHQNLYLLMMIFAIVLVASDMVYELAAADKIKIGIIWQYIANICYFISTILIAYTWFSYSERIAELPYFENFKVRTVIFTPAAICSLITISSIWTGWIFYLDENGNYYRGSLNAIAIAVPGMYFLAAVIISLFIFLHKRTPKNKDNLSKVISFAFFPITAVAVQVIFVGAPVICIGAVLGMLWVFLNNITGEREQMVTNSRIAEAKSQFFASMSHELRTPINAVLGMNTMILRESNEPQITGYAKVVENSGKMLLSTVNDILDFSKAESGNLTLINTEYETADLIRDLILMVKSRADGKGLKFITDIEDIIPSKLYGDDVRIKQVIVNLLTNAVKYTDRGSITLKMHYRNADEKHIRLQVAVSDTGKGIKAEDMEQLFSPYVRIDEQMNRKIEGTGLGMFIVKTMLNLMDSEIQVDSVYGEGSTFSFEVIQEVVDRKPMGSVEEIMQKAAGPVEKYKALQAPDARILTVDDTAVNLIVFKELLKKTGMRIDTATSGLEALSKVRKDNYDIIFLDHMMPGMDGIETLEHMRKDGMVPDETPIIVLTANVVSGYKEMFMKAGFTDFLAKPIEVKELDKMILKYLPKDKIKEEEPA